MLFITYYTAFSHIEDFRIPLQSPHGKDFKISCNVCHGSKGWALDKEIYSFDHSSTNMPLVGQHKEINCRMCHTTLVFSDEKAKKECVSCHTDIHSQTVGNYCDKCHTPNSWIVNTITEIHQQSRFPLLGVHTMTECQQCHLSETLHRYDVKGVECFDCHIDVYMASTNPNHATAGFSTDCSTCHFIYSPEWGGIGLNHSFFPLTQGHNVECSKCHTNNNFSNLPTECVSCHLPDYNAATDPVHVGGCYPQNCEMCHTTTPGWSPTSFQHNNLFPISSGDHGGMACVDCHTNPSDCKVFSCIDCHEHNQSEMNNEHDEVSGYSFNSNACYNCHPNGKGD